MAVLNPVKVVLINWPEGEIKTLTVENHPKHPEMGTHTVTFGRELWIEREDFLSEPIKGFKRMYPGNEVRLKGAYIVRCDDYVTDADGKVTEIRCTVDLSTESGTPGSERKIKGATLHWVNAADCTEIEARLYEPLLTADTDENEAAPESAEADAPDETEELNSTERKLREFIRRLNPDSLTVKKGYAEPIVREAPSGSTYQFLRTGYFCKDPDSTDALPVFNRTVSLRDSFSKQKAGA